MPPVPSPPVADPFAAIGQPIGSREGGDEFAGIGEPVEAADPFDGVGEPVDEAPGFLERIGIAQPGSPVAEKGILGVLRDAPGDIVRFFRETPSAIEQSIEIRRQVEELDRAAGIEPGSGRHTPEAWRLLMQNPVGLGFGPGEGLARGFGRVPRGAPAARPETPPAAPEAAPAPAAAPVSAPALAPETAATAIPEKTDVPITRPEVSPVPAEATVPPAPVPFAPRKPDSPSRSRSFASAEQGGLTEPRIAPTVSKNVVDAAGDLLIAGKVQRDPKRLISDQITDLLQGDKLTAPEIDAVLSRHGVTPPQLAELFRSDIGEAGRSLQRLSALERRLRLAEAIETLPQSSLGGFLKDASKATTREKLAFVYINWLVTNPTTQAANFIGNSLTALLSVPEQALAGGIGAVRRGFGGRGGVRLGETPARIAGMTRGVRDGLVAAWQTFTGRRTPESKVDISTLRTAPGQGPAEPVPVVGLLGTRLLSSFDELFKAIAARGELNALAIRQAAEEGLSGRALTERAAELLRSPGDDMTAQAATFAEYQTFQKELGDAGKALMTLRRKIPALMVVTPFIRTPVNILKYAAERTPLGLLSKEVRANLRGKNGEAARDSQTARLLMGSAIGATVATMAAEGLISGGGPSDPSRRNLMRAQGWQPYSVKIGDRWVSYNRLEPLGLMIGLVADMTELSGEVDETEMEKIAVAAAGSVAKSLLSKTYLSGLAELISAVDRPDMFGESYVRRLLGTAIPPGVALVARIDDPVLRDARSSLDAIRARIPGESEELPARLNLFGEPIVRGGAVGPDILSPIQQSTVKRDPVIEEMLRLDVTPSMPQRRIRGVDLTTGQYAEFVARAGRPAKPFLTQIVTAPGWAALPDKDKAALIEKTFREFRDAAAEQMLIFHPELLRAVLMKAAER